MGASLARSLHSGDDQRHSLHDHCEWKKMQKKERKKLTDHLTLNKYMHAEVLSPPLTKTWQMLAHSERHNKAHRQPTRSHIPCKRFR